MLLAKTSVGLQALKDRKIELSSRQRPAFILFDGRRSTDEVLQATHAMGITWADIEEMINKGLLSPAGQADASANDLVIHVLPSVAPPPPPPTAAVTRSNVDRFKDAYPIAIEITGALGLRGFRMQMSVEATQNYEQLAALAPRMREIVPAAAYERFSQALFD